MSVFHFTYASRYKIHDKVSASYHSEGSPSSYVFWWDDARETVGRWVGGGAVAGMVVIGRQVASTYQAEVASEELSTRFHAIFSIAVGVHVAFHIVVLAHLWSWKRICKILFYGVDHMQREETRLGRHSP